MLLVSALRQLLEKKRCYTTYCINCYNWFWCVEKYLCFKRHVGPIVQKGHIVNIPLSEEETDMVLQNRLYMPFIHPMRSTIYTSWKSTQLHIKYREDKIFALGSRDVNDYVATVILRQWSRRQRIPAQLEKGLRKHLIYRVIRLGV